MIKAIHNWFNLSTENAELRRNLKFQIETKRSYYSEIRHLQGQIKLWENEHSFRGKYLFEKGSRAKLNRVYIKLRQRADDLRSDNQKLLSYIDKRDKIIIELQEVLDRSYDRASELLDHLDATRPREVVDNDSHISYDTTVSELLPDIWSV